MSISLKKIGLLAVASLFVLTAQSCGGTTDRLGAPQRVTLEWWTVFKEPTDLNPLIDAYEAQFPHININVRVLRYDEFENTLVNALAEDRGPDIFTIHNTEIGKYATKTQVLPSVTSIDVAVERGALRKETFTETRQYPSFNERYLRATFLDQVLRDVYRNQQVHGLPLSVDTLSLYYNKDLLNAAGIPLPATTYTELQEHVLRLTKQNTAGALIQSGIALGTSGNVERFSDIMSLLMMQNGTQMTDDLGNALFDRLPPALQGRTTLPAQDALVFYTDFANPTKQVYTWNEQQPSSLEAFMSGRVAYFLGYAYHMPMIRAQAPKLNFAVGSMLQIQGNPTINFANYWVEVVSNKSENVDEAWNFLQFATQPENVRAYLTEAQLPTATKTLVAEQSEDPNIGVFADQLLTAQSWYRGNNPTVVEESFADMITQLRAGELQVNRILTTAVQKINQTLR